MSTQIMLQSKLSEGYSAHYNCNFQECGLYTKGRKIKQPLSADATYGEHRELLFLCVELSHPEPGVPQNNMLRLKHH